MDATSKYVTTPSGHYAQSNEMLPVKYLLCNNSLSGTHVRIED